MKQGLLWFDDNPGRDLAEKVTRAARRYQQKFGASPNVCYVHPSTLSGNGSNDRQHVGEVCVAPSPAVLRHHFWVGQERD